MLSFSVWPAAPPVSLACVGWASVPSTGSGQAFCLPTIGEIADFVPRGQTVKLSAHPTWLPGLPTIGEVAGFVPRGQTMKLSAHPTGLPGFRSGVGTIKRTAQPPQPVLLV